MDQDIKGYKIVFVLCKLIIFNILLHSKAVPKVICINFFFNLCLIKFLKKQALIGPLMVVGVKIIFTFISITCKSRRYIISCTDIIAWIILRKICCFYYPIADTFILFLFCILIGEILSYVRKRVYIFLQMYLKGL